MDLSLILDYLVQLFPVVSYVLMALGAIVVIASAYVKITPTPKDDEFIAKLEAKPIVGDLLKALRKFAPFK